MTCPPSHLWADIRSSLQDSRDVTTKLVTDTWYFQNNLMSCFCFFYFILFNFHFLSVSVTLSWMSVYLTWTLKPENTQSWKQCVRDRKASKPGVQHGSRSHLHVAGAVFETQNNSFLFSAQSLQKQLWFPGPLFWATEAVLPYLNTRATLALTYVL